MAENLSMLDLMGKTFKGIVITDPVLEPYFIIRYEDGAWAVAIKRTDYKGNIKFRADSYPATFEGCLKRIVREKAHEESQEFKTVREYIDYYNSVVDKIVVALKDVDKGDVGIKDIGEKK